MSYATLDDLRAQLGGTLTPEQSAAYVAKMHHPLPEAKTVDRVKFILDHCTVKRVLEFGASGPLTPAIQKVAREYMGIDRVSGVGNNILGFDLDDVSLVGLPMFRVALVEDDGTINHVLDELVTPEIIICGEVLEHLGNPLWFLTRLRKQYAGVPLIITVPNAFSRSAQVMLAKGIESVNGDHVAWYSPKTISVLLTRAGYGYAALYYYNGTGPTAEGLVVVTE